MSVFDPGSVNLGAAGEDGLPGRNSRSYTRTAPATSAMSRSCCDRSSSRPERIDLRTRLSAPTLVYRRAGKLPRGAFIKLYFGGDQGYLGGAPTGVTFGLPPTKKALDAYLEMLEGCDLPWAVAVLGGDVVASGLAQYALERGGHLRVGLEDYAGARTPTNVELVDEVVALVRKAGRPIASPADAAKMLSLPR